MGIFSKKKKDTKKTEPVLSPGEMSEKFAALMAEELQSRARNESSTSSQISHVTANPTAQPTIINILKQQHVDQEFFIGIICLAVFAYAAFSFIVSIVSFVLLLSFVAVFLPPLEKDRPENIWQRLKRSLSSKTNEEIQREQNKKVIKQVKKALKSKDVGRGIANIVDAVFDSD